MMNDKNKKEAVSESESKFSEELLAYLQKNSFAYAGLRILHIYTLRGDDAIAERDEVPLLDNPAFLLIFPGYIMIQRILFGIQALFGRTSDIRLPSNGHLFTMTSDHEYRTYSFIDIATELKQRDQQVQLLCSPSALSNRNKWEQSGLSTVSFKELLGRVRLYKLPLIIANALRIYMGLGQVSPYKINIAPIFLIFNILILEQIKRECIREIIINDPIVHTYSPMPYILESTSFEHIYVYQHGTQWHRSEPQSFDWPIPPFVPLTYFVWGQSWVSNFEEYAHPNSRVVPIGSPWYDHLAEQEIKSKKTPSWDVLFVSNSPQSDNLDEKDQKYEDLFKTVLEACKENELSLAIKLHPMEPPDWYKDRGWGEYIVNFGGIEDALSDTRLAVTDNSSAFVESAVLGTPIVVTDISDKGFKTLGPVKNVTFTDELSELRVCISQITANNNQEQIFSGDQLIRIGGSTNRIVSETIRNGTFSET